jgi:hypothetical protein
VFKSEFPEQQEQVRGERAERKRGLLFGNASNYILLSGVMAVHVYR